MPLNEQAPEQRLEQLRREVSSVLAIESVTVSQHRPDLITYRGRLLTDSDRAFALLRLRLESIGYTPTLRRAQNQDVLTALPGLVRVQRSNPIVNLILFVLTVITTTLSGGTAPDGFDLARGMLFSAALLSILGVHELGHYFMARRYGAPVTLPYFIPLPPGVSFIGTMGAFIRLKAPFVDRRSLFDVGIAGPLAGLAVAVPLLIIGLSQAEIISLGSCVNCIQEGNSVFYAFAKYAVFGKFLPGGGEDVFLSSSPVASAAWLGLFITALNLLPAGQLDGGHVAYALLGSRARYLGWLTAAVLLLLTFPISSFYPGYMGWLFWVAFIFLTGVDHPSPLNDIGRLDFSRKLLGAFSWVLFVLLFTPLPFSA